jgi:hypothetical protein
MVLEDFILELWNYTVLSQYQTDTAVRSGNTPFYSNVFHKGHVTKYDARLRRIVHRKVMGLRRIESRDQVIWEVPRSGVF